MKLYIYVVTHDAGFAPNPFWDYCTLATCKPTIRRCASVGDWVAGMGSMRNVGHGKLIYAMKISEILPFLDYDADLRFNKKKPNASGIIEERCGDNIYYKTPNNEWKQRESNHKMKHMERDLKGRNVLIAGHFYYFGKDAVKVPQEYNSLVPKGRGHLCNFDAVLVNDFLTWLQKTFKTGIHGKPYSI
ncbi:MAG: hypothetical protein KJ957_07935 [Candidatus Omnitrophica bacterium]|nr:hypothetical protein [Candidatus Omnitrophota bacterium]MBU1853957.1 hypothetical protein [Candidatus Omnitrophota bacterium]